MNVPPFGPITEVSKPGGRDWHIQRKKKQLKKVIKVNFSMHLHNVNIGDKQFIGQVVQ